LHPAPLTETPKLPADSTDAAWVHVPTTLPPETLWRCLRNTEFLFRLNPYYHVKSWQRTGDASFHVEFRNESNDREENLGIAVETGSKWKLTLRYDRGIKDRTVFFIEPAPSGARLTVTDCYDRVPAEERLARMSEVDRSLPAWGAAMARYFRRLQRWSWLPGWRRYIHGPWMRMTPAGRRVVWFLMLVTIAEFVFFLFVLLIYVLEQRRAV
jgi:hypothetical protein